MIEVYLCANEPQTLSGDYSRATKNSDAKCKQLSARLDDVIKTCEKLHVENQKYEHLFDGTLGEFNIGTTSLKLMG
jgi:hypothetical protein